MDGVCDVAKTTHIVAAEFKTNDHLPLVEFSSLQKFQLCIKRHWVALRGEHRCRRHKLNTAIVRTRNQLIDRRQV